MSSRENLQQLAAKYIEERCSAEELDELGQLLLASPDDRRIFINLIQLDADLHILRNRERNSPTQSIIPVERLLRRQRRRAMKSALLAAAAVLVIVGIALSLFFAKPDPPALVFRTAAGAQVSVTHASPGDSSLKEGELKEGSRIEVRQGVVELEFASGTRAVVQGPSTMTFVQKRHLAIDSGTAWFRIARGDEGFLVVTPQVAVRDLGTEFGIVSSRDVPPQVHVFEGEVEVTARQGVESTELLRAGQASEVSYLGRLRTIPLSRDLFHTELPSDLPYLYISFDGKNGQLAKIAGSSPVTSELELNWRNPAISLTSKGVRGEAARFDHKESAILSGWPGVLRHRPFSVACWIRFNTDRTSGGRQCLLRWGEHTVESRTSEFLLNLVRVGDERSVPQVTLDNTAYAGTTNVADGEWHHLVVMSHGSQTRVGERAVSIFVDGRPETVQAREAQFVSPGIGPEDEFSPNLLIGRDRSNTPVPSNFTGEIDELYIFEAIVPPERVKELSER